MAYTPLQLGSPTSSKEAISRSLIKVDTMLNELYNTNPSTIDWTNFSNTILPSADSTYDLGSANKKWRSLYVSSNTIYIGTSALSITEQGNIQVNGNTFSPVVSYNDLSNKPTIPTSFSSLVNGAHTVSLGTDGLLTFPGAEGFRATFGDVFPVGDVLHSVNSLYLESEATVGLTSGADVAELESTYLEQEELFANLRDQDEQSGSSRPWVGLPSYEAYDLIMAYNEGVGLPLPGSLAPAAYAATTAYYNWQSARTSAGVLINVADKQWVFGVAGDLRVPGTISKTNILQLNSLGTGEGAGNTASVSVDGNNGRLLVRTGDSETNKDWTFGLDGTLTFPDATTSTGRSVTVPVNQAFDFNLSTSIPSVDTSKISINYGGISTDQTSLYLTTSGSKIWIFNSAQKRIEFNDSSAYIKFGTETKDGTGASNDIELFSYGADNGAGAVYISAGSSPTNNRWKFDTNGSLTFPDATVQTTAWTGSVAYSSVTGTPTLATVATSGSYADLTNKPTIPSITGLATESYVTNAIGNLVASAPTALNTLSELATALGNDSNFSGTVTTSLGNRLRVDINTQNLTTLQKSNAVTNLGLATVAASGSYADLSNKPTLFSGSYADLSNKPSIPTNTNQLINGAGFITSNGIPTQTGNSGKYLTTDGTSVSWGTVSGGSTIDSLTDVVITSATTGQVLKFNGSNWVNDVDVSGEGTGGTLSSRTSRASTTATIANGASENITITGFKGYIIYKLQTSAAAWVRAYTSIAERTADESRTITTDPTPGSGVVAEIITTGAQTVNMAPATIGFSNESAPDVNIPIRVTNRSGSSAAITVTMTLIQIEV